MERKKIHHVTENLHKSLFSRWYGLSFIHVRILNSIREINIELKVSADGDNYIEFTCISGTNNCMQKALRKTSNCEFGTENDTHSETEILCWECMITYCDFGTRRAMAEQNL